MRERPSWRRPARATRSCERKRAFRDNPYQQIAAIKLVRGGFGSDAVISRFNAERQILADLEHPNIAALTLILNPEQNKDGLALCDEALGSAIQAHDGMKQKR